MQNQNAILIKNAEKILQTKIRLWVARSINKLSYIQSDKGFEEFVEESKFADKEILATPTSTSENLQKAYIKLIDFASLLVLALRYCEDKDVKFADVTDDLKSTIEDDFGKEIPTISTSLYSSYQPKFLYIFYYSEIDKIKNSALDANYLPVNKIADPIPRLPAELFTSNISVVGLKNRIKSEYSYFVSTSRNISAISNKKENSIEYYNVSYRVEGNINDLKKIKSDQILKNKTFFITIEPGAGTITYLCYYDTQSTLDLTYLADFLVKLKDGTTIIAAPIFITNGIPSTVTPEIPVDNIVAHAFFERFYIVNTFLDNEQKYYRFLLRNHNYGKFEELNPLPENTPLGNGEHYLPDFTTRTDKNFFKIYREVIKMVNKKEGDHPINPFIYNFSTIANKYNQTPFSSEEFQMMSSRLDAALYFTLQTYL